MQIDDMKDYVNCNEKETIDQLLKLVRIPTVTAKGGEFSHKAIDELEKLLSPLGFETEIIKTPGQPVLLAKLDNNKPKTLLFYDHYDVQPSEPDNLWDSPAFDPEVREGKIFGRGVADNKGEIIVRAAAIKMLLEQGELPINIKFVIEGEEEVSSPNLPYFVKEKKSFLKNVDGCIWEFGGKNINGIQEIWAGVKGICYVQLKTSGPKKDLHSAYGAIVSNPANHLIAALASLRDDKTDKILIDGYYDNVLEPTPDMIEAINKIDLDEDKYKEEWGIKDFIRKKTDLDLKKAYYFNPTCTTCGIWSGWQGTGGKTVLPAFAQAKIDFRLVPNQDPNITVNLLKEHFRKNDFEIEIEWHMGYKPAYTPISDPFIKVVENSIKEIYNHEPEIHPWSAGSGPLYLFNELMPVASIGVGNVGSNAHSPNENIEVEDFKNGQLCIAQLILNMGK